MKITIENKDQSSRNNFKNPSPINTCNVFQTLIIKGFTKFNKMATATPLTQTKGTYKAGVYIQDNMNVARGAGKALVY